MKEVDKNLGQFTTPTPGRVVYPNLTKEAVERRMAKFKEKEPRYTTDLMFEPDDTTLKGLYVMFKKIAKEAFGDAINFGQIEAQGGKTVYGAIKVLAKMGADREFGCPFLVGDELADADENQKKEFYRGQVVFRSSSPNPVSVGRWTDQGPVLSEASDIYGGSYAVQQVNFRPYPEIGKKGTKGYSPFGVKAFLNGIVFIRDGERIGTARDLATMFSGVQGHAVATDPRAPTDGDEEAIS